MPRDPIANHGSELTDLQGETAVLPRGYAYCMFIKPNLSAVITWIESTIEPRLSEKINPAPQLCIEKERQARIEKLVDLTVNESRRRLIEVINFDIYRATHARSKIIVERCDSECAIEPVKIIIDLEGACSASQKAEAECPDQLHTMFMILTRAVRRRLRHAKADLKLGPIIFGPHQL